MANNGRQLIVGVVDKSGSMMPLTQATQTGWSDLLSEQASLEGYQTFASLYTFNHLVHTEYEVHEAVDIPPFHMTANGTTALLDAINHAISRTEMLLEAIPNEDRPGHVMCAVFTDGMENSSVEASYALVRNLIERKRVEGWKFSFAGANMDAIQVAVTLGIDRSSSVTYNTANTEATFNVLSSMNSRGLTSGFYSYTGEERRRVQ